MRQYECECTVCGTKRSVAFREEPYPEYGDMVSAFCSNCGADTRHTRTLTRKTAAELRRKAEEENLRQSILDKCAEYGFSARFLHQPVIITTSLADWCFDYHESLITLYHESTYKINLETGLYAKAHVQFSKREISPVEVVKYIAEHDAWRAKHRGKK
ncbi:MAG: hypothetical protein LUG57_04810 [Oscillospiraceae bacterium]|nr:hypothetical protein [Oscillospiraceae bacterium]